MGAPDPGGQKVGRVMGTFRAMSRAATALVTLAALGAGVQLASAPPAAALLGVFRVDDISGTLSLDSPKDATVACPDGVLVGGGAEIEGGGEDPATEPRLTHLVPTGNQFFAMAETPNHASEARWLLRVYAICADGVDSSQVVPGISEEDSQSFKDAEARCPDGTVAFGAGGQISYNSGDPFPGRVGLQLVRPSEPLDITRATGREYGDGIEDGYIGNWRVHAWAICVAPAGGIHAEGTIEPLGERANHECSSGTFVHGAGGGGGPFIDGGDAYLQYIIPSEELTHVFVRMTQPLDPSVGGMVASATCAE
jgi:hypothetical protein